MTDALGTKVEVKNLNSFKSVEGAIAYEVKRHAEVLEAGGTIAHETRGWDEAKSKTFSQRLKETSEEYRYFPDPDLPKFVRSEIPEFANSRIAEITPNNPAIKRAILSEKGLAENQIEIIISDISSDKFFTQVLGLLPPTLDVKLVGNYFVNDVLSIVASKNLSIKDASAENFVQLLSMLSEGVITTRVAKDLLQEVLFEGSIPADIAKERGLIQDNSTDALTGVVDAVIAQNESVVLEYKAGKVASIQFLLGQCMKATRGSGNPELLKKMLEERLR
jgi:aspartyl-tRNA(Asn)/glutamyl-tRNA(Gln) amidotransferase subunit B